MSTITVRYGLEKHKDGAESEEEIWAEELLPKVSKPVPKAATPTKPSDNSGNCMKSLFFVVFGFDNWKFDVFLRSVDDLSTVIKMDVASVDSCTFGDDV